jgi:hypothetical protein
LIHFHPFFVWFVPLSFQLRTQLLKKHGWLCRSMKRQIRLTIVVSARSVSFQCRFETFSTLSVCSACSLSVCFCSAWISWWLSIFDVRWLGL